MDDLMQEGYIALCEAVEHYEIDKGVLFISYAGFWIKQRLHRYAERSGTVRFLLVYFRMLLDIRESVKNMQKSAVASHQIIKSIKNPIPVQHALLHYTHFFENFLHLLA